MREVTLSTQKGGINRLRSKGGASPETLYLLVNGYVTTAKTIRARPGLTLRHTLFTAPTIGLTSFNGQLVVFSASTPGTFAGLATIVLPHPSNPALTLAKIQTTLAGEPPFPRSVVIVISNATQKWLVIYDEPNDEYWYELLTKAV